MKPLDSKLLRDLWHIRGQALAIAAVIACGLAIMLMTYGAMTSLQETQRRYYETYRFADVFADLTRAPLSVADAAARLPGVAAVDARIVHGAPLDIPALGRPASAELVSLPEAGAPALNRIVLRKGRLPQQGRDELVMSENMADALAFGPGSRLSVTVNGRKRSFTVVGVALSPEFVYVLPPGQIMPDDKAYGVLWLDRAALEAAYDMKGAFNHLSVLLSPGASEADVIARLDRLLARYGGAAAYGRNDQISHAYVAQELEQLRTIAMVIPPVFLGVAAFLIHMVMMRLVDTEREAIGLLKSFGYTGVEVGWHYLKFALLIAAVGLALGLMLGLALGGWMTTMYQDYFHFPFLAYRADHALFAAAAAISLAAALGGTLSAVRRAMRLAPATAMLPPAPPVYRRSLMEWLGIGRHLSVPTRMIFRHIGRWPLRAFLTGLGVAMAAMLLVSLLFFFDAIDAMVDSFYFDTNRQDVTVALIDRRNDRARFEIARLPGVRAAEPALELPARLSRDQISERLVITGLDPGGELGGFRDAAGRPFSLPHEGLVLSDKLAGLFAVTVGERVNVEMLAGARRRVEVAVAGISREYVGLSAYMARPALARLSGESGVTSFRLATDPAGETALFERLKALPAVGAIATRRQAIAALTEIMARSMTIVIDFYVGLGGIIAFGVLYNAARISLSERARELGSLRVLGFTRAEVAYVLVGELAILVIAALPFGCLLGYGLAGAMSRSMDTKLFRVPFVVEPSTFGLAAAVVLTAAALSIAAVAGRVYRLDLIAVLKTRE